jgi:hypothetical protein
MRKKSSLDLEAYSQVKFRKEYPWNFRIRKMFPKTFLFWSPMKRFRVFPGEALHV